MGKLLDQINLPNDIQKIPKEQYGRLAQEIREELVRVISINGGHLGSNLGAVELTMALHLSLHLPDDKIIWDVGHQSYTHKLLTGRREQFETLRRFGGLSGFPKREESDCDVFDTGHSSTSISAGLGLVKARDLQGGKETIVSVIGDGSITGGLAYEALNNAAKLDTNFIIILNDNNMSISENVGGISSYLDDIRTSEGYLNLRDKIYYSLSDKSPKAVSGIRRAKNTLKSIMVPGMFFEEMGITYLGPVDGHNISQLMRAIRAAKRIRKAVLVHVITKKGKGYEPAIRHPARFHGTGAFDIATGLPKQTRAKAGYSDIFSTVMVKQGARNPKVVAITAAMADGVGLKRFRSLYPDRFVDVGIAEQHAVTYAAGLAAGGMRPVFAVYSTFLQRAYDQIIHDVCLQKLPVLFAIDRAGIVGADGETHQGIFDLSYLLSMPDITVMAPKNKWELSDMIKYALTLDGPSAIRYPRGEAYSGLSEFRAPVEKGRAEVLFEESEILLFAIGNMVAAAEEVRILLHEAGHQATLINARFAAPFDRQAVRDRLGNHKLIVTMEDNVESGGLGEHVAAWLKEDGTLPEEAQRTAFLNVSIPDHFVRHGKPAQLYRMLGMEPDQIKDRILRLLEEKEPKGTA